MPSRLSNEFVYQVVSLLLAFILVHALFVAVVRPQAEADQRAMAAQLQAAPDLVPERSFYVVVKDYEQEACFVLMLWALAILGYKGRAAWAQQRLLGRDLLQLPEGLPIGAEDTRALAARLEGLAPVERDALLPRALLGAVERFAATRNVQDDSSRSPSASHRSRGWSRSSRSSATSPGRSRR